MLNAGTHIMKTTIADILLKELLVGAEETAWSSGGGSCGISKVS